MTLREWAAFIFKCEFEPKSLDASSKEILNCKSLRQKQYNMLGNDLTWEKLHAEEKSNSTATTAIEVSTMDDKELYLNMCEALRANASKTTKKHDKVANTEAIKALVEIVNRKFDKDCTDIKEAIRYLTQDQPANLLQGDGEERYEEDEDHVLQVESSSKSSSS